MPDVRLEDGTIVRNVPEGMTQSELLRRLGRQPESRGERIAKLVAERPEEFDPSSPEFQRLNSPTGSALGNFLAGAGEVFPRLFRGGKQLGADTLNRITFAPDLGVGGGRNAPFQQQSDDLRAEEALARERDAPLLGTTSGQVGNVAGNIAALAPTLAIPGINTTAGSTILGGALGALQPITDDESRGSNIALGGAFGAAGQEGGRLLSGFIGNQLAKRGAARQAQQIAREPLDALLNEATDVGLRVPPSTANPSLLNRTLEGVSGKVSTAQGASVLNQRVFNRLAKDAVGIADDVPLSKASVQAVRRSAGQIYDDIGKTADVVTDQQFLDDLVKIPNARSSVVSDFPDLPVAGAQEIDEIVNGLLVDKFKAKSAIELIKQLRRNATSLFKGADDPTKLALARANRAAADAVDDMLARNLERTGRSDLAAQYQAARKTIAQTHTIEAALNEAGNINAKVLARQIDRGVPLSGGLGLSGRFANAFPQAARSTTESFPLISPLDLAAFGGPSAITGNPIPAAIGLTRPLLRRGLLSAPAQNALNTTSNVGPRVGDASLNLLDFLAQRGGVVGAGSSP